MKKALEKKPLVIGNESKIPEFAVYSDTEICGFFGPWRWLSNFYRSPVWYEDHLYPSVENGYQAMKYENDDDRIKFLSISPTEAKKLGQLAPLRENWNVIKFDVMSNLVFNKFDRNLGLRKQLLDTGSKLLEERNYWDDVVWGTNMEGVGQNNLGKILMKVREFWK